MSDNTREDDNYIICPTCDERELAVEEDYTAAYERVLRTCRQCNNAFVYTTLYRVAHRTRPLVNVEQVEPQPPLLPNEWANSDDKRDYKWDVASKTWKEASQS